MKVSFKNSLRKVCALALSAMLGVPAFSIHALAAETKTYDQTTLFQEGYDLDVELEEEGTVLFQNKNNVLPLSEDVTADLYGYFS